SISHQSSFVDSARIRKIDYQGVPVWSNDIVAGVTAGCAGSYIIDLDNIELVKDDIAYSIMLTVTYCGGADGNRIGHFTSNGIFTSMMSGEPEGDQNYSGSPGIAATDDGSNDVNLFYSNGNGSGAHGSCLRLLANGDTLWGPIDVLQGTNGLNYEYRAASDSSGIAFAFVSTGAGGNRDIFIRKIKSDGSWAWTSSITTVCNAGNDQDNFYLTQDAQFYYLCWDDARPGAACGTWDVYAQKIDKTTGAIQWAPDGVLVFNDCTYIPYPKLIVLGNGKIMVTNESTNSSAAFNVTKLNSDGSLFWSNPVVISNGTYAPFYDDYNFMQSGSNRIIAWSTNDNVYICHIQQPVLNIADTASACSQLTAYGQSFTVSGSYNINLNEDTTVTLAVTIDNIDNSVTQVGNTLTAAQSGAQYDWINCNGNISTGTTTQNFTTTDTGYFAVIIHNGTCADTSACFHINSDFVPNVNAVNSIASFPNPFTSYLNISNASGYHLQIFDLTGRLVIEKNISSYNEKISAEFLADGNYFCRFTNENFSVVKLVTKISQ
ncbi:MAG: T9SS type A sorting domain-containing protein, partial [Bacteroidota bacterium]